ncbi:hypothetical protein GQ600_25331 [Phytophthora cactorum]|nr:hypothetical protein GQ600_25331 [Phytophthora cactorum]
MEIAAAVFDRSARIVQYRVVSVMVLMYKRVPTIGADLPLWVVDLQVGEMIRLHSYSGLSVEYFLAFVERFERPVVHEHAVRDDAETLVSFLTR